MSTHPMSLVRMRGVTLQFDAKVVLNGVDLSLEPQEALVIMGLSGCGKSTLLSILLGLLIPNSGTVYFQDKDLRNLSRRELNEVRKHIGMVYQNAALLSSLSIGENVGLPLRELTNKTASEIEAVISEKLELVGLLDAKEKLPSELSGGMQKRAGLARALALNPELVLFDEPSAGLDPINSGVIHDLIIKLREEHHVTSIIVTHEMESAFLLATRMAFLDGGKIILEGKPDDFRDSAIPVIQEFLSSYTKHEPKKE